MVWAHYQLTPQHSTRSAISSFLAVDPAFDMTAGKKKWQCVGRDHRLRLLLGPYHIFPQIKVV